MNGESRAAVEVAEQWADCSPPAYPADTLRTAELAIQDWIRIANHTVGENQTEYAHAMRAFDAARAARAAIDVLPLQAAMGAAQHAEGSAEGRRDERGEHIKLFRDIFGTGTHDGTMSLLVRGLAEGIYADRAFDRLPILADALEEAGCTDAEVLAHCRGPGPHVRGCWVVDLILGKE
jgi:hypothetical protein